MKRIIIMLFIGYSSVCMIAQSIDINKTIEEISKAAVSIKTLKCNFIQTKTLEMLNEKIESKGVMYCSQPNQLRWEYLSPYTYTFILNHYLVLLKNANRNDIIDVKKNRMFGEIARIMMNSVLGKCLTDKKSFKINLINNGTFYVTTLIPLKKEMKQAFSKIILYYDHKTSMVIKVEMHEKNGDKTLIELINIQKNTAIDASIFEIQ